MSQQMINSKGNTHGLVKNGTGLLSGDRQQPKVVKKTALQDLQNNIAMVLPKHLARSGPSTDPKLSGTKRPAPQSPPCDQSASNNGIHGNFVYMRRKSEQELVKSSNDDKTKNNDAISPQQRQFSEGKQKLTWQQTQMQGPNVSCYSAFAPISMNTSCEGPSLALSLGKPVNASPSTDLNLPAATPGIVSINPQKTSEQHFKERFLKLQIFLKNYDNSSHEEYNQMLRSLSSAGRSKHAVELEKRAIHLMLEESKELQRMKNLNILAKSAPKTNVSPSPANVPQGNEKAPISHMQ